jgi:hypothetical protein
MTTLQETEIPADHFGTIYTEVMKQLSLKRGVARYLEIGVNEGNLMQHIHAKVAIGVDPEFSFRYNIMPFKGAVHLYQVPSDEFFSTYDTNILGGDIDLAFLDGMHTFEYLLRDFYNTERLCNERSLIVMHDCLPLNEEMTHRNFNQSLAIGMNTTHPLYWTGDVWKIIPILKKYRPDLKLVFLDAPPTGLVCVTNLDKTSNVLSKNYIKIIEEYRTVPSSTEEITKLYGAVALTPTREVLNDFDHSLYFRS